MFLAYITKILKVPSHKGRYRLQARFGEAGRETGQKKAVCGRKLIFPSPEAGGQKP